MQKKYLKKNTFSIVFTSEKRVDRINPQPIIKTKVKRVQTVKLILDGDSEIGARVRSNFCYLNCFKAFELPSNISTIV